MQFIPPRTSISNRNLFILSAFNKNTIAESRREATQMNGATVKVKKYQFKKDNSPINFRSYITLIIDGSSFSVDHRFYATDMFEAGAGPDNFPVNQGDKFYLRGKSGYGKVSGIVAGIGLLAVIYAAAQ
jgi:hypothetical protein